MAVLIDNQQKTHPLKMKSIRQTAQVVLNALDCPEGELSILLVEFVKNEVALGKEIREAAVSAAKIRLRPILITSLTLMAGAAAIIGDPIFEGMAVTLLFGAGVATLFTMVVIPMGCISMEKRFVKHGCEALEERLADSDQKPGEASV